jgi:iron complex outermembrane receptor protein
VKDDEAFTGRSGITYMLTPDLAAYASYSESFLPTLGTDYQRDAFDPTTGQQYEAGIKYELGKQLRISLALFDITQQNVLTIDSAHTGTTYWCGLTCQTQTGEVRSKGFEAEAVATLTEGLSVVSSYTIMDVEVTKSERVGELGNVPVATPEQMASIFADYTFQHGVLAGFGFGAGARYIGKTYRTSIRMTRTPSMTRRSTIRSTRPPLRSMPQISSIEKRPFAPRPEAASGSAHESSTPPSAIGGRLCGRSLGCFFAIKRLTLL